MVFMRCSQCGKDITSKPCPYCGNKHVNIEVQVSDGITVSDEIKGIVIGYCTIIVVNQEIEDLGWGIEIMDNVTYELASSLVQ